MYRLSDVFKLSSMVFTQQTGLQNLYSIVEYCLDAYRYVEFCCIEYRADTHLFQKSRSHHKILGATEGDMMQVPY
jgi:hypothetical protein